MVQASPCFGQRRNADGTDDAPTRRTLHRACMAAGYQLLGLRHALPAGQSPMSLSLAAVRDQTPPVRALRIGAGAKCGDGPATTADPPPSNQTASSSPVSVTLSNAYWGDLLRSVSRAHAPHRNDEHRGLRALDGRRLRGIRSDGRKRLRTAFDVATRLLRHHVSQVIRRHDHPSGPGESASSRTKTAPPGPSASASKPSVPASGPRLPGISPAYGPALPMVCGLRPALLYR
jgi:hypothetical protein